MESRNKLAMCRLSLCENECFINVIELDDGQGYIAAEVISDLLRFQDVGNDSELCDQDPLRDASSHVTIKSEDVIINTSSYVISEDPLKETEVSCVPILLKYEVLPLSKDSHTQKELIDSVGSVNQGTVELTDPLMQDIPQVTIKSEEVVINTSSSVVSEDPLKETEVSCGPILLKYDVLPLSRDSHTQEELIDSGGSVNQGTVEFTDPSMQDFPQAYCEPLCVEEDILYGKDLIEAINDLDGADEIKEEPNEDIGAGGSKLCEKVPLEEASYDEEEGRKEATDKEVTGNKGSFECHSCRKVLKTKRSLRQHLRTHGIGTFVKCKVCDKICVTKAKLINHSRTHTDERPYKCADCSKRFRHRNNLMVHMRVHRKTIPFKRK